ncbi:MAG: histidinol-phosphatase HisJ family protein [Bacteroidales bacterium]|nr:histidinol-phosphatase HisJ family protein [Bacteroidales bacterium]
MIYKTDYHLHTTYSDGIGPPEEFVEYAINAGLKEIGFSEHLSLFKKEQNWCMNPDNISIYIGHINSLKEKSKDLIIRTGLEVDYIPGKENETGSFLEKQSLDYILGSVHYLGERTVDEAPDFYEGKDIDDLFGSYFDRVMAASSSGLFDIIAHCDLIRIFGFRPSYDPEPLYRKLAKCLRENDVAFELNTNGRNRPIADFYPDRRYLHIFREEDVAVCVNSDAHRPVLVAQYFDEAYDLLRSAGYTEMAVYAGRKRNMVPF